MSNPTGKNQYSGGAGGLSAKRAAKFKRDTASAARRIDSVQSKHAKTTGFAMSRSVAALRAVGKR